MKNYSPFILKLSFKLPAKKSYWPSIFVFTHKLRVFAARWDFSVHVSEWTVQQLGARDISR